MAKTRNPSQMKDKGVVVSFRVDRHLADVLKNVPDKSSFIRDVILRSFYRPCPLCQGRGVLPEEIAAWASRQLKTAKARTCSCCRYEYPGSILSREKATASRQDRFVCPYCRTHDHGDGAT